MQTVIEVGNPKRLTASGQVVGAPAGLMGIFVAAAAAAPTIQVFNSLTGAGEILVGIFTPTAGVFYPMPFFASIGIFVVIANTVDCTVSWGPVTA